MKKICKTCVFWMGDRQGDPRVLSKCIHYYRVRSRRFTTMLEHCKNWRSWLAMPETKEV